MKTLYDTIFPKRCKQMCFCLWSRLYSWKGLSFLSHLAAQIIASNISKVLPTFLQNPNCWRNVRLFNRKHISADQNLEWLCIITQNSRSMFANLRFPNFPKYCGHKRSSANFSPQISLALKASLQSVAAASPGPRKQFDPSRLILHLAHSTKNIIIALVLCLALPQWPGVL